MNKKISDMMDAVAADVELEATDLFDAQRIRARTLEKLHAQQRPSRPRRWLRILPLAAVIAGLLAATAFAGDVPAHIEQGVRRYFGRTEIYEPAEGDVFTETGTGENAGWQAQRDDVAMILRYEVPKTTRRVLVRPGWLPGEPSYQSPLGRSLRSRDDYERSLAEAMIESTKIPEAEWDAWDMGYFYSAGQNGVEWELTLIPGFRLYRRDMTLGQYGGDAGVERQWTDGDWSGLEITLDYSACRSEKLARRGVYHHLLLFNERDYYLVNLCGKADFETLERIAAGLEFCVTGSEQTAEEPLANVWNYELLDAGVG